MSEATRNQEIKKSGSELSNQSTGWVLFLVLGVFMSCSQRKGLDAEALMDPAACQGCHPEAYREWSGSMHAYASDDPVFIALNAFAQRLSLIHI